jgi:hypothetical protein
MKTVLLSFRPRFSILTLIDHDRILPDFKLTKTITFLPDSAVQVTIPIEAFFYNIVFFCERLSGFCGLPSKHHEPLVSAILESCGHLKAGARYQLIHHIQNSNNNSNFTILF